MGKYILRRFLISIPVLFGVTLLIYLMVDLAPGDPVSSMISPRDIGSNGAEWAARERARLGLDKPWPVRYGIWLGQVARGNLGYSMLSGKPVSAIIGMRLGATLRLTVTALVISSILSLIIGVISAVYQYRPVDHVLTTLSLGAVSVPGFFLGLLLIYVFALRLHWLPTGGVKTAGAPDSLGDSLTHLVLPATVLAISLTAGLARYTRSAMIEILHEDYIRVARAKGLTERVVLVRHAIRNCLLPIITITGMRIPLLFGGAVVVEQVFAWEGIGQMGVNAVFSQDYPLVMALNLMIALVVIASNLLTDIAYAFVDPRINFD